MEEIGNDIMEVREYQLGRPHDPRFPLDEDLESLISKAREANCVIRLRYWTCHKNMYIISIYPDDTPKTINGRMPIGIGDRDIS